MKKIKMMLAAVGILLLSLVSVMGFTAVSFAAPTYNKDITTPTECGTRNGDWTTVGSVTGCYLDSSSVAAPTSTVNDVIKTVITIVSWVVGAISVIMIIASGLMFTTSAGNPEKAKKARSTIVYALIGIVVVALSQVIVNFVIKQV